MNTFSIPAGTPKESVRYPEEYKRQIVSRVLAGEQITTISREKDIAQPTIARWVKDFSPALLQHNKKEQGYMSKEEVQALAKRIEEQETKLANQQKQINEMQDYINKLQKYIISTLIDSAK